MDNNYHKIDVLKIKNEEIKEKLIEIDNEIIHLRFQMNKRESLNKIGVLSLLAILIFDTIILTTNTLTTGMTLLTISSELVLLGAGLKAVSIGNINDIEDSIGRLLKKYRELEEEKSENELLMTKLNEKQNNLDNNSKENNVTSKCLEISELSSNYSSNDIKKLIKIKNQLESIIENIEKEESNKENSELVLRREK